MDIVKIIEVTNNMEMNIPFSKVEFMPLSDCLGRMILRLASDLRPCAKIDEELMDAVDRHRLNF